MTGERGTSVEDDCSTGEGYQRSAWQRRGGSINAESLAAIRNSNRDGLLLRHRPRDHDGVKPVRWLVLVVVVVLGVPGSAACGGDDEGGAGATTPASGPPPQSVSIDQDNLKFKPSQATVAAGGSVTFTNSESALHTVSLNGKNLSGDMRKGDVFTWPAEAPGEYRFICDYHPQMRATVTVIVVE